MSPEAPPSSTRAIENVAPTNDTTTLTAAPHEAPGPVTVAESGSPTRHVEVAQLVASNSRRFPLAAGVVVGKVGTATASGSEILEAMHS